MQVRNYTAHALQQQQLNSCHGPWISSCCSSASVPPLSKPRQLLPCGQVRHLNIRWRQRAVGQLLQHCCSRSLTFLSLNFSSMHNLAAARKRMTSCSFFSPPCHFEYRSFTARRAFLPAQAESFSNSLQMCLISSIVCVLVAASIAARRPVSSSHGRASLRN